MKKVAIVYWSGTGNTRKMADLIAEGAVSEGAEVELFECNSFSESMIPNYDVIAFGCACMGCEELEDEEFLPMFEACKSELVGKEVALFGSYGWGGGEYMTSWEEECKGLGMNLIQPGCAVNELPAGETEIQCIEFGKAIAK